MNSCKVVFLKPWLLVVDTIYYYYNDKFVFWVLTTFSRGFQQIEFVLFRYCINKLCIFEVSIIGSLKTWVGSTKIVIEHGLQ
jgi:hypothetical protein